MKQNSETEFLANHVVHSPKIRLRRYARIYYALLSYWISLLTIIMFHKSPLCDWLVYRSSHLMSPLSLSNYVGPFLWISAVLRTLLGSIRVGIVCLHILSWNMDLKCSNSSSFCCAQWRNYLNMLFRIWTSLFFLSPPLWGWFILVYLEKITSGIHSTITRVTCTSI